MPPRAALEVALSDWPSELAARLDWLRIVLVRARDLFRVRQSGSADGLGAIAVFEAEVDAFLESAPWVHQRAAGGLAAETDGHPDEPGRLPEAGANWASESPDQPLGALQRRFDLSPLDIQICLLCLAPELHPGFGRVYAWLHNDVTRNRASMGLAMDLLAPDWRARLALRSRLGPRAPLIANHLIHGSSNAQEPSLEEGLILAAPVLAVLLGDDTRDPGGEVKPAAALSELVLESEVREMLGPLGSHLSEIASGGGVGASCIALAGPEHAGKRTVLAALAHGAGLRAFVHGAGESEPAGGAGLARFHDWLRDVRLIGGIPAIDLRGLRGVASDPVEKVISEKVRAIVERRFPVFFLLSPEPLRVRPGGDEVRYFPVSLGAPRAGNRSKAWRRFLELEGLAFQEPELHAIANTFPLTAGQIKRAARDASIRIHLRDSGARGLDGQTWRALCRGQARHDLDRLAERVATVHGWEDLVLPPDPVRQLHEVAEAVHQREQVLERWHFGDKVSVAPGISVLFWGASGTGKTMAAGVLARELGMDIYRIDLSCVVSKYIGETEKNLDALFQEARRAYAVLFFDEADALFGKRSEVKDAHDRYANIEVAFLLQRMESYDGITILATNLRNNLDQAFLRRLQFAVEFPDPSYECRLQIWCSVWPREAALGPDVDLSFMARQFPLPGGNIRNIALRAAYLAASAGTGIGMVHLVAATRREFQKFGRFCSDDEFGAYRHLLNRAEPA